VNEVRPGHLLLADITGYTALIASTEFADSEATESKLLQFIIEQFMPMRAVAKIEADTIFAYVPVFEFPRGDEPVIVRDLLDLRSFEPFTVLQPAAGY